MKKILITVPTIDQVTFEIECIPEELSIKGNASAIDEDTDKETEQYIKDQLNSGNEWAWCCIKVTASYKGIEGTDYLGGCSYASKEDFISGDGYYTDMKQAAYDNLVSEIESLQD